jgi:hypothetical protein
MSSIQKEKLELIRGEMLKSLSVSRKEGLNALKNMLNIEQDLINNGKLKCYTIGGMKIQTTSTLTDSPIINHILSTTKYKMKDVETSNCFRDSDT